MRPGKRRPVAAVLGLSLTLGSASVFGQAGGAGGAAGPGAQAPGAPAPGAAPGVPNPTGTQGNPALVDPPGSPPRPARRDVQAGANAVNNAGLPGLGGNVVYPANGGLFAPGGGFIFPPSSASYNTWGGWVGTVPGDVARGLGAFAAGAGMYNRATAEAAAINTDTVMRFNEYLYESQQIRNRRYYERLARERQQDAQNADAIYRRLHDSPEARDITSGAALNVVLDELTDPGLYVESLKAASGELGSEMVRNIPFRYSTQAITISLNDLLRDNPPAVLQDPAFKASREGLIAAADAANAQLDGDGDIQPETLRQIRNAVDALWSQFDRTVKAGTPDRRDGENYLKGVYGLTRMLESPQLDRYLGDLNGQKTVTLGNLIGFMNAFNLRFGPAEKPAEVDAYQTLYPRMVALRDQVLPPDRATARNAPGSPRRARQAAEIFSGLQQAPPPTPNPPADRPARTTTTAPQP